MRLEELTSIPIVQGGGKLEVSRELAEKGFPVPKSQYVYYPDLDRKYLVLAAFKQLRKPVIVRGSHANDWEGYIDVLPTKKNVSTEDQLFNAIKEIKVRAAGRELEIHAADWNQPFTPEVHVLLQEQSPSPLSGSMLRHPHELDRIDVNYVDRMEYEDANSGWRPTFSLIRQEEKGDIHHSGICKEKSLSKSEIDLVFQTYEEVENSGLFDKNWVYQMEIGLKPFMIYQIRPFKQKEPSLNFEVPFTTRESYPSLRSGLSFGITPPEGREISFYVADSVSVHHSLPSAGLKPYSLLLNDRVRGTPPARVEIGNLEAYSSKAQTHSYLEHGEFRFLRRARYSLLDWFTNNVAQSGGYFYYPQDLDVFREARLWSNGQNAVLIPAEFVK